MLGIITFILGENPVFAIWNEFEMFLVPRFIDCWESWQLYVAIIKVLEIESI